MATEKASNFYLQTGEDKKGQREETNSDEAIDRSLSPISGRLLESRLVLGHVENVSLGLNFLTVKRELGHHLRASLTMKDAAWKAPSTQRAPNT